MFMMSAEQEFRMMAQRLGGLNTRLTPLYTQTPWTARERRTHPALSHVVLLRLRPCGAAQSRAPQKPGARARSPQKTLELWGGVQERRESPRRQSSLQVLCVMPRGRYTKYA